MPLVSMMPVNGALLAGSALRLAAAVLGTAEAFHISQRAWALWALLWLALAFFNKSTKRSENRLQRIEHLIPGLIGFLLVFREGFGGQWLAKRIIPETSFLASVGAVITLLGLLFAVWARLALGTNWSGTVTIKSGHQLVRRGPYRWIRHPIYTGMLAALFATAMVQGLLSGALGFALVYGALYRKARREESFLAQEFGAAFAEHQQHTGMFFPRFF